MPVDQHPTLALVIQVGQLLTYGFGAIAACVAILGLNTWRRQLIGTQRIQLATETLEAFYQCRDCMNWIRSRSSFQSEYDEIKQNHGESDRQYNARSVLVLVIVRYRKESEKFAKLQSLTYKVRVLVGAESAIPFDLMRHAVLELFSAVDMCMVLEKQAIEDGELGNAMIPGRREQLIQVRNSVWGSLPDEEPDSITKKVNESVEKIESICAPLIDPPSWRDRFFGTGAKPGMPKPKR